MTSGPKSVLAILLVAFVWLPSADAAVPRLLMVHGGLLPTPIVIDDWPAMFPILDSDLPEPSEPRGRPYLDLALFWGTEWVRYVEEGRPIDRLRPEDVTPFGNIPIRGKFYPACGSSPAVIAITPIPPDTAPGMWRVSEEGLRVLERFGVPIRMECK